MTAQKSSITSTHYSLSLLLCFSLSSVREREKKKRERERLLVFLCVFVFGALKSLIKEMRERPIGNSIPETFISRRVGCFSSVLSKVF